MHIIGSSVGFMESNFGKISECKSYSTKGGKAVIRTINIYVLVLFVLFAGVVPSVFAGDAENGKKLFNNKKLGQCSVCHKITDKQKAGPGLAGIMKRRSEEWVKTFIKDPRKVWTENNAETQEMKKRLKNPKKKKSIMTSKHRKKFTDQDIEDIVEYFKTL